MKHIVIIGGGITGLSTAYFLKEEAKKRGLDISYTLIEKRERLGGNIRTEKVDGFVVEGGPDCFLSEKPWALNLCNKLKLQDQLLPTNKNSKTFVLWKKRLHPLPEGFILMIPTKITPFIFNGLFTIRGKLRMAFDLFLPRGEAGKDESLASFVRRRLGQEALDKIAEPLVAGVHAGDPETMSLKSCFPKFLDMEQEHGSLIIGMLKRRSMMKKATAGASKTQNSPKRTMFMSLKDGLTDLTNAIINRLDKDSLITGKKVESIEKTEGSSYKVQIEGEKPITADGVILAAPAYASARLTQLIDPELSESLNGIPYVSTATISLAYKTGDIKEPLKGFGFVVPRKEKRRIMAATWTSLKFANRCPEGSVLIRCFVGGSKNEEILALDDEELVTIVKEELKDIVGIEAKPLFFRVFRWNRSMPQYVLGHSERVEWIKKRLDNHPGLLLAGGAYSGIGISDCIHSGELASQEILELLYEKKDTE